MQLIAQNSFDFGENFWKRNRMASGKSIDQLRGQNIPHNSKSIDKTSGLACIISHKSTDIRRKSYTNPKSIFRLGMRFVHDLAIYQGEVRRDHKIGATYHLHWATDNPDCKRILEWYIPASIIPEEKINAIKKVIITAKAHGVKVNIYTILDY